MVMIVLLTVSMDPNARDRLSRVVVEVVVMIELRWWSRSDGEGCCCCCCWDWGVLREGGMEGRGLGEMHLYLRLSFSTCVKVNL